MNRTKWGWSETVVIVMMVGYIIWFGFLSIRQHEAFVTGGFDLGNVDQAVWNTSRGRFLRMTTMEGQHSRLGLHVEPILLLLVPLYWVVPDPRMLLVVQTVVLASGAWAAYQLTRWKLGYSAAGVAMAAVYLLSPIVEGANLFQFHAVAFAAALFLFAIHHMLRGEFGRFALFAGLAACCKEEVPEVDLVDGGYRTSCLGSHSSVPIGSHPVHRCQYEVVTSSSEPCLWCTGCYDCQETIAFDPRCT